MVDRGIYPKYLVFKHPGEEWDSVLGVEWRHLHTDGTLVGPHVHKLEEVDDFTFVLKPIHDKHARVAMAAYAESVKDERPQLAKDISEVLGDF